MLNISYKHYSVSVTNVGKIYTLRTQFTNNYLTTWYSNRNNKLVFGFELTGMGVTDGSRSIHYTLYGIAADGTKTLFRTSIKDQAVIYYNPITVRERPNNPYYTWLAFEPNKMYTNYEFVVDMTPLPAPNNAYFYVDSTTGIYTQITDFNFDSGNTDIGADLVFSLTRDENSTTELYAPYVYIVRANGESIKCTFDTESNKFIVPGGFLKSTTETLTVSLCEPIFAADNDFILFNNSITKTFENFTQTYPTIAALEPDGISQNRDKSITVSWVANNQSQFKLEVLQNNVVLKTYTGTSLQELVIPANTLPTGIITLRLTTWYISSYTTTDTKEVQFLAYGTPNAPIQDNNTLYSTARPMLTWSTDEQTGYYITIEDTQGNIIEAKQENNANKSYTVHTPLSNNTNYVVRLRIKNVYDLWSADSLKTITISFTELTAPTLNLYLDDSNVVVNITSPNDAQFDHNEIYRKSEFDSDWTRICTNIPKNFAWVDKTLAANTIYYYKIRSVSTEGGIVESEIKDISVTVNDYNFYKVEDLEQSITFVGDPKSNFTKIRNTSYAVFAGCTKPTLETGFENYYEGSFSFFVDIEQYKKFIKFLEGSTILLFKDYMGKKAYGFIHGNIEEEYVEYIKAYIISFNFVEVDFDETDMYVHQRRMRVVYLDGTYKLDGSITLSGVVEDE